MKKQKSFLESLFGCFSGSIDDGFEKELSSFKKTKRTIKFALVGIFKQ
jgi:hypothetical protein